MRVVFVFVQLPVKDARLCLNHNLEPSDLGNSKMSYWYIASPSQFSNFRNHARCGYSMFPRTCLSKVAQ